MADIIKVYTEELPPVRLIGKRYRDTDRGPEGSFGALWREWLDQGRFQPLETLPQLLENGDAYLGFMRCTGDGFEYWIGQFFPEGTGTPKGYDHLDLPAGTIGVCWVFGEESTGEIYGEKITCRCIDELRKAGYELTDPPQFFERYNCPRFTVPNETGKVILDMCFYLA